jgi:hypothetical protein
MLLLLLLFVTEPSAVGLAIKHSARHTQQSHNSAAAWAAAAGSFPTQ